MGNGFWKYGTARNATVMVAIVNGTIYEVGPHLPVEGGSFSPLQSTNDSVTTTYTGTGTTSYMLR